MYIAGIDEAGRGPLMGPVTAACVILKCDKTKLQLQEMGLTDSKKLSVKKRQEIFYFLKQAQQAQKVLIGFASINEKIIDKINILNATKLAMQQSYLKMVQDHNVKPSLTLVDGNFTPDIDCKAQAVVKGDQKHSQIAAASVIAKVNRDKIVDYLAQKQPVYNWQSNKGYATKDHIQAIKLNGASIYHRQTFAPIKNLNQDLFS